MISMTALNRFPLRFLALCLVLLAPVARADLLIDVTRGVTDAVPIAVVPFARAVPADGGLDVGAVVQHDLDSSGRFKSMERRDMLTQPVRARDVQVADWRAARNDYMVVGRVVATVPNELTIEFELLNLLSGQVLLEQRVTTAPSTLRFAAHRVADLIYERLTGIRGAFSTRIAYVSVDGGAVGGFPSRRRDLSGGFPSRRVDSHPGCSAPPDFLVNIHTWLSASFCCR